ncbi:hypothetical protein BU23DRAFT_528521 [Bimuria novae-zelandiae CBS 107.79]|uniref:B30.2/SPRY domain-containing protein n=1 Tax=Bimuria novae-zelandiae CBS 107.79 TaxID=1447943 RepID=A0A6A5VIC9_9PLEO|nr:hypothetical protein BU23DRAFT_528521 [Bimuria novae-zelandiae CBS 107.79]
MATSAPSSRLYKDALTEFKRESEGHYHDSSKKLALLKEFLAQRGSPEEAQSAAGSLREDAGKKWGSKKVGDAEIPAAWIDNIMANIGNFVEVGNYAMKGAPESVGLAWFAVKLTLSAIQSNYELYAFFGSGLTDISEIMIMIPHYDRLYDERSKPQTNWKPSPVVEKLFQDIIATYAAVLRFSFSIKRHLSAGTLAKIRHGFKDFFGTSKEKFKAELDLIASLKQHILEESQAIFQDKTLHNIEDMKGTVSKIEGTVKELRSFQSTLQEMHQAQTTLQEAILNEVKDIKATTKPKTPWDLALQEFEKNRDALKPLNDTGGAFGDAIDRRHPNTCKWIFEHSMYTEWVTSDSNELFCLSGQQGSGKSIVLASVVEQLDLNDVEAATIFYLPCGTTGAGASSKEIPTVDQVCNTLLCKLYSLAREDEDNVKLLEDCNKVFKNPKAGSRRARSKTSKDDNFPEFADAFLSIAERLKLRIIVALDKIHTLSQNDQQELATRLQSILIPEEVPSENVSVKFLVGCRSNTGFHNQILAVGSKVRSIDVGDFNDDDMVTTLSDDLKDVAGLTEAELTEASEAILTKAGPRFAYIRNIAIPFMREPFQRPLSRRLLSLPENMNNIYNDALHRMSPNYVDLLRTALTLTLLSPEPPKVQEVMDAYQRTYESRGPEVEAQARALDPELGEDRFSPASDLQVAQLRDASGPFLRVKQQNGSDEYFVHLQDPARVREFCLSSSHEERTEAHKHGEICARCKSDLQESKTLSISEKEGHLDMAMLCLRAMNNPIFQRRSTADEEVPQWSQPEEVVNTSEEEERSETVGQNAEDISTATLDEATEGSQADNAAEDHAEPPSDTKQEDEKAEDAPVDSTSTDDSGYESDRSVDDEDRGDVSFAPPVDKKEDTATYFEPVRKHRHEAYFWHHIVRVEELWSPEELARDSRWLKLMSELDHLVSHNPSFFYAWQKFPNPDNSATYHTDLKPLHLAAVYGLIGWAEHLLANGADPNEKSGLPYPKTPLQMTAWNGNSIPMLKLLLEHGSDPNVGDQYTYPAFHEWMYEDSSKEVIELFLKHGADTMNVDEFNRWTVLHYFASCGKDVESLDLLLKETPSGVKSDINYCENTSPLHVLLLRREVPRTLLQAFLDRGADINKDDSVSARPLQLATLYGDLATVEILCKGRPIEKIDDDDDDGDSALHQAAIAEHPKIIAFLADLGANVNLPNKAGLTAIHDSALRGNKECTEILLAHGAQSNLVDQRNRNVLFYACLSESVETANLILDTLLEKKSPMAEINAKTKRHRTPLRQAAGRGFDTVVAKLIEAAKAEDDLSSLAINEPDKRKRMTPLHRAAWFGKTESVRLLLAAGADAKLQDNNDKTALILAYEQWALTSQQKSFEDVISLLIESDPSTAKNDPELVAVCAVNGSIRLLKQLVAIGAGLNRQDQYGWTPLELLREFQAKEAGELLKQQDAWAGILPSKWANDSRTVLSEDGKTVKHTSGNRVCVSANKPLPAGLERFYFETTIEKPDEMDDQPEAIIVALGFCTISGKVIDFPGWPPRLNAPSAKSWGYHGDDGGLFISTNESGSTVGLELPYYYGDTVGCGVNLTTRTIWFTRNGAKLQSGFDNVQGRLFPVLGLKDSVVAETNFTGPFIWKAETEEAESATTGMTGGQNQA